MIARRLREPRHERWLLTSDGVRIRARHLPGEGQLALVVVHGFSASMTRPPNRAVLRQLNRRLPVVAIDLRGHGTSYGMSTLGDLEVHDVAAAVAWARLLGYEQVVTVGFSMGAAICVRHAGLAGGVDGIVSVSGPAFWNYRGTTIMRRLHFGVENRVGRLVVRHGMRTKVIPPPWPTPFPPSPEQAAHTIPPTPFLIVHGTADGFFPDEHPRALLRAARAGARERGVLDRSQLWLADVGHAEAAMTPELLDRIGEWVVRQCATPDHDAAGRRSS